MSIAIFDGPSTAGLDTWKFRFRKARVQNFTFAIILSAESESFLEKGASQMVILEAHRAV